MVEKCIKFDRLGPGFSQTEEIANLDLKIAKQALGVLLGSDRRPLKAVESLSGALDLQFPRFDKKLVPNERI